MKEPKSLASIRKNINNQTAVILKSIDIMMENSKKSDPESIRSSYFRSTLTVLSVILEDIKDIKSAVERLEVKP